MQATATVPTVYPLSIGVGGVVSNDQELAVRLWNEAIEQVNAKGLQDLDAQKEFLEACLALAVWRVRLRVKEDHGDAAADDVVAKLKVIVCEWAQCNPEE